MTRREILLIANPASGGKPGSPAEGYRPSPGELARLLTARGLRVRLHELGEGDDITRIASEAAVTQDVVVAGGDGTVGPAAIGLLHGSSTLGVIPLGSFNNLARGAQLPLDVEEAIEVIARGEAARIDAGLAWPLEEGHVEPTAGPPPDDATVFFEAAGVGLDAVGFGFAEAGTHGIRPALGAARQFLARSAQPIRLSVDGRRYRAKSPAITVCNGPFHGFGFGLAPDAQPDDGELDLVIFRRMNSFEVLRHFLAVARGRRRYEPRVEVIRCREVVVWAPGDRLPAHADGTAIGTTPLGIAVLPGALRIFR